MRIDLHVHTCYSPDSRTSLDAVARWMARRQLDAVAITDHNAIAGALALQRRLPGAVIVGEEIQTTHGEIIGLFLQEAIAPGLPPREATRHLVRNTVDYLPIDEIAGRIATTLWVVYPPGIATIVPGERLDERAKPMIDYLKVFQESANRFPGFDNEIQGLYRETDAKGVIRYFTYVVRE